MGAWVARAAVSSRRWAVRLDRRVTSTLLPTISRLAHKKDVPPDNHPEGGLCLQLDQESDLASWRELVRQHHEAFEVLAAAAMANEDSWHLTRQVLFAAHHVCEIALKMVIKADDQEVPKKHALTILIERAEALLTATLDTDEVAWLHAFVREIRELTAEGFEGRYIELDSTWCCLDDALLQRCVRMFVALCYAAAE